MGHSHPGKSAELPSLPRCHPSAHRQFGAVEGNSQWLTADFCSLHDETSCSAGTRVCLRCLKSPSLWGLALGPGEQPLLYSGGFSFAGASKLLCDEPALGRRHFKHLRGKGCHSPATKACTALRQDKGLDLTHLSSGQMSKKSLLSCFGLNHQYTKTPSFSQECWKSCS